VQSRQISHLSPRAKDLADAVINQKIYYWTPDRQTKDERRKESSEAPVKQSKFIAEQRNN
jgi:hypothetical protein